MGKKVKTMTEKKTKQVRVKRWMKICGGMVVAIALFFLLMPFGVKYYLTDWLEKNGADSATIQSLRFNPFKGQVTLGEMDVQLGGRSIIKNSSVVLDVGLTSLFNHDVRVEKAEYNDFSIDLEQYKDGSWRFGSYTLQGKRKERTVESGEKVASAWKYLADQVVLKTCSVHLKTPDLDMTLVIEEAELTRLTTRQGQPVGTFTFKGQLNDSPVSLQLDTVQLVPELQLGGKILIAGFQLDELSRLLSDVMPTLAGEVGIDGKLLFIQGTESGIVVDYDGSLAVTGPDIGNNDFSTKADSLSWKGRVHYVGPGSSPVNIETDGLLSARDLKVQVPVSELVMEESLIELSGKTTVTIAENILINNDGSLLLEGVELVLPPYGIVEESLSWKGVVQYDSDHEGEGPFVSADGSIDLGEFQLGGGELSTSFAMGGKMASWQGAVGFSQKDSGNRSILDVHGSLVGGDLLTTLAEPQLRIGQEKFELKTDSSISLGESTDIGGLSSLTLVNFSLFEGENNNPTVSFDRLAVAELEGRGGKTIGVKDIFTAGLKSTISGDFPLTIDIPEIKLSNILTEDLATFTAGELNLKNSVVTALQNNEQLVRLDELSVNNISLDDGLKVGVENVRLQNFAFLGSGDDSAKKSAVSFADATLGEISWSNDAGFQGDTLHFDDLVAKVIRDKDGNINITQQLAEMQTGAKPEAEQSTEPVTPPAKTVAVKESKGAPFRLQKIVVAGKSAVFFQDYTLAVPYITDLNISKLEVTSLDSSQPDQETEILLEGELEKRAPLMVDGHISPFKEKPSLDMKLKLKNYPLSSLSSYTVQSVGTALASGQLKVKTKIALADDELDMDNEILLKKLETKTISPELAAELDNQLPIPLDSALSLLRDSKGNISLTVPLSGPVNELNVGVSDVLITALSKAIVPAASGYLMYALGPYGALAYVGMKVGENALQVTLPPVVFVAQENSLTKEHIDYLQRIGKILQDRSNADIQLCPQVASWEFLTEEEKTAVKGKVVEVDENDLNALLALGQQRGAAVQSLLEDDYGIARNRLLLCDTKIEIEKDAVPVVLLQL
jgi:hypothetical protein